MAAQRHIQPRRGGERHSDDVVLDAVRASVLAVGVRRTTLTDVSRRAGVSRMTLYRRWGDVDRLVRDLMAREFSTLVPTTATGSRAELVAAVVAAVSALRHDVLFARVLDVEPDLLLPYVTDRLGSTQHAVVTVLTAGIRAAQDTGTVRPGEPDRLAHVVLLIAQPFAVSARTVAGRLDEAALDAELSRALDGYLRP
jgi:AcrR family transcriptional regulator